MQPLIQPPLASLEKCVFNTKVDFSHLLLEEIEKTSSYKETLLAIKKRFKTELHSHLGGAVPLEFIAKYSTNQEYCELLNFISQFKKGIDYQEAFKPFSIIGKILSTNKRIEEAAYEFCQNQHKDHVNFSELRTGLKRLDGSFEDYLKAVIAGLEKGMRDFPLRVTLVLSLRRDTSRVDANEMIDLAIKYHGQIVRGIDVSGESTKGDGQGIFEALQRAKACKLPITLHIGENESETPAQQIKELTEIQPLRVGHAVHLCQEAKSWIESHGVVVEACLRSASSVKMIMKPSQHPALDLFKKGHPVIFCSDDSTLFGNLSEELAVAALLCDISLEQIVELQNKALAYAF